MVILVQDETKVNGLLEKGKHCGLMIHWLVMPWKLQDPGVNLTYETEQLPNGTTADILQLTFNAVGVTPENKYWLYVDKEDSLNKAVGVLSKF
jgi:hypothetical protein